MPTIPAEQIDHLVLLTMENRSFDHYLGSLALGASPRHDVEGLVLPPRSIPDLSGNPVANWQMDGAGPNFPDIPHGLSDIYGDFNGGRNDGFVTTYQRAHPGIQLPNIPMGYYTSATLPVLYALAEEFVVCDHWFASVLSSTWPNRKYLHSGRSDDDKDTEAIPGLRGFQTTPMYDYIETRSDARTNLPLTWKCYFSDVPFLAFWYKFTAFHALHNFCTIEQFVDDCREDRLPTISIIDPPFTIADDHAPHDPKLGQKFIGLVVDALTHSESWATSALVILYDECGGFYDHVIPPAAPEPNPLDTPLGFRVPALIVSPYSRKGHISTTVYEHTSLMRSIADRWNIAFGDSGTDFGQRWKYTNSFWDVLDFAAPARPLGNYTGKPLTDVAWTSGLRERLNSPMGHFESLLERIFILPELKALDRRAAVFDTLSGLEQSVATLKRTIQYES